jgi:hypothetical protein
LDSTTDARHNALGFPAKPFNIVQRLVLLTEEASNALLNSVGEKVDFPLGWESRLDQVIAAISHCCEGALAEEREAMSNGVAAAHAAASSTQDRPPFLLRSDQDGKVALRKLLCGVGGTAHWLSQFVRSWWSSVGQATRDVAQSCWRRARETWRTRSWQETHKSMVRLLTDLLQLVRRVGDVLFCYGIDRVIVLALVGIAAAIFYGIPIAPAGGTIHVAAAVMLAGFAAIAVAFAE